MLVLVLEAHFSQKGLHKDHGKGNLLGNMLCELVSGMFATSGHIVRFQQNLLNDRK